MMRNERDYVALSTSLRHPADEPLTTPYDPLDDYTGAEWFVNEDGVVLAKSLYGLSFHRVAVIAKAIVAHNKEMLSPPKV